MHKYWSQWFEVGAACARCAHLCGHVGVRRPEMVEACLQGDMVDGRVPVIEYTTREWIALLSTECRLQTAVCSRTNEHYTLPQNDAKGL